MKPFSWIPLFRLKADTEPARRAKAPRGSGPMQVRDVLCRLADCRSEIKAWLDSAKSQVANGRSKLLLDYIRLHEEHIESCLAQYSREKTNAILDTWLPYGVDRALIDSVETSLDLGPSTTVEDVVGLTLQVDRSLMDLYSRLASGPLLPQRVRELFEDLLELEQNKDRKLSLALLDS